MGAVDEGRRRWLRLLLWPTSIYLGLCALVYVLQDRLLFFPRRALDTTPAAAGLEYEDVWIDSSAGRVHGWFVPHEAPIATVVFCHGNAGNISDRVTILALLHSLELEVLIFDYPGYGRSEGEPSEPGLHAAADAAWERAAQLSRSGTLVAWGRSLGGGVASALAARHPDAGALVIESSFTTLPDLAQEHYWWLPARWLTRTRLATVEWLSEVRCPVLVVHSAEDEIVPFAHAERLFAAAPDPKALVRLDGNHDGGFVQSSDTYMDGVRSFLARNLQR